MDTGPPPKIPTNLPLPVAIHTKSQQLPFNSCWNVCLLLIITSPATILNLPINSSCPLDTDLVLTSGNFHLIFPPPFSPSCLATPWWYFWKTLTWCHHYHVFIYFYSLLIEKGIYNHRNWWSFHVFVCTFFWRSLHFGKSFHFLFLFILLFLKCYMKNVIDLEAFLVSWVLPCLSFVFIFLNHVFITTRLCCLQKFMSICPSHFFSWVQNLLPPYM